MARIPGRHQSGGARLARTERNYSTRHQIVQLPPVLGLPFFAVLAICLELATAWRPGRLEHCDTPISAVDAAALRELAGPALPCR